MCGVAFPGRGPGFLGFWLRGGRARRPGRAGRSPLRFPDWRGSRRGLIIYIYINIYITACNLPGFAWAGMRNFRAKFLLVLLFERDALTRVTTMRTDPETCHLCLILVGYIFAVFVSVTVHYIVGAIGCGVSLSLCLSLSFSSSNFV
jgi:hypothetical protein